MLNDKIEDFTQFNKLVIGLTQKGYVFTVQNAYNGRQVIVYEQYTDTDGVHLIRQWDAVIHGGSYGHEDGLLEIYGTIVEKFTQDDEVLGRLTAIEILNKL